MSIRLEIVALIEVVAAAIVYEWRDSMGQQKARSDGNRERASTGVCNANIKPNPSPEAKPPV